MTSLVCQTLNVQHVTCAVSGLCVVLCACMCACSERRCADGDGQSTASQHRGRRRGPSYEHRPESSARNAKIDSVSEKQQDSQANRSFTWIAAMQRHPLCLALHHLLHPFCCFIFIHPSSRVASPASARLKSNSLASSERRTVVKRRPTEHGVRAILAHQRRPGFYI